MSKKDKEIPSKEDAKSKIANHEIDETLQELAFSESEEEKEEAMKHKKKEKEEPIKTDWTEEELRELVKKAEYADRYMEQLMRIQAEFENHKKRLARDKEEFLKLANEGLIESLLPVLDNFDLALQHAEKDHDPKHIVKGIKMIRKLFEDVLKRQGVTVIDNLGDKFDPHKHEAIGFEETDDAEEGKIVEVIQKGILLHNRLVRPATVKITKKKA